LLLLHLARSQPHLSLSLFWLWAVQHIRVRCLSALQTPAILVLVFLDIQLFADTAAVTMAAAIANSTLNTAIQQGSVGVSFSGAGFLIFYYIGEISSVTFIQQWPAVQTCSPQHLCGESVDLSAPSTTCYFNIPKTHTNIS
jgi:hypothetical protein